MFLKDGFIYRTMVFQSLESALVTDSDLTLYKDPASINFEGTDQKKFLKRVHVIHYEYKYIKKINGICFKKSY
jgi:hypothetical protein